MSKRKVHHYECEDYGRWEYHYLTCWGVEYEPREGDKRKFASSSRWEDVTCKRCLAKRKGGEEGT